MKRRNFLAGAAAGLAMTGLPLKSKSKETAMSNIRIWRNEERGQADHGWLKARFSFSFSRYYDPRRMGFGKLRVLNDDRIAGGGGFPTHPHDNFEIVTIPLSGSVAHKDTTGGQGVIEHGEVQIMSAGSGIQHSEFNASRTEELRLLQIWVEPEKYNIKPRYDQRKFDVSKRKNRIQYLVSPDERDESLWINQQAWFSMSQLDKGKSVEYKLNKAGQGVYLMVLEGGIEIGGHQLNRRDAAEIKQEELLTMTATEDAEFILIEVPLS